MIHRVQASSETCSSNPQGPSRPGSDCTNRCHPPTKGSSRVASAIRALTAHGAAFLKQLRPAQLSNPLQREVQEQSRGEPLLSACDANGASQDLYTRLRAPDESILHRVNTNASTSSYGACLALHPALPCLRQKHQTAHHVGALNQIADTIHQVSRDTQEATMSSVEISEAGIVSRYELRSMALTIMHRPSAAWKTLDLDEFASCPRQHTRAPPLPLHGLHKPRSLVEAFGARSPSPPIRSLILSSRERDIGHFMEPQGWRVSLLWLLRRRRRRLSSLRELHLHEVIHDHGPRVLDGVGTHEGSGGRQDDASTLLPRWAPLVPICCPSQEDEERRMAIKSTKLQYPKLKKKRNTWGVQGNIHSLEASLTGILPLLLELALSKLQATEAAR